MRIRRRVLEHPCAVDAGLARRNTQVDDLARTEQAEIAIRGGECIPLEAVVDDKELAFLEAGGAGSGADQIPGLHRQQGLVAVHDIERTEAPGEVPGELRQADLHRCGRLRRRGATAARLRLVSWRLANGARSAARRHPGSRARAAAPALPWGVRRCRSSCTCAARPVRRSAASRCRRRRGLGTRPVWRAGTRLPCRRSIATGSACCSRRSRCPESLAPCPATRRAVPCRYPPASA